MPKKIDLTGVRFGRLTVIRKDNYTNWHTYWVCQCDCGNQVSVSSQSLRKGATRSCGCLRRETSRINGKTQMAKVLATGKGLRSK